MMNRWTRHGCALALVVAPLAWASDATVRICDAQGCSDRARNSATFDPGRDDKPDETRRLAALEELARRDPRAAYDLGLRHLRGDGVPLNSYQGLQWMREAAQGGVLPAQAALGRLYLTGLQEMGPDPAEAARWLDMAAARGDAESARLLPEARQAQQDAQSAYASREALRKAWPGWWATGYRYYWVWSPAGWSVR